MEAPIPHALNLQERGCVLFVCKHSALVACMKIKQPTIDNASCFVSHSADWKLNLQQVTCFLCILSLRTSDYLLF